MYTFHRALCLLAGVALSAGCAAELESGPTPDAEKVTVVRHEPTRAFGVSVPGTGKLDYYWVAVGFSTVYQDYARADAAYGPHAGELASRICFYRASAPLEWTPTERNMTELLRISQPIFGRATSLAAINKVHRDLVTPGLIAHRHTRSPLDWLGPEIQRALDGSAEQFPYVVKNPTNRTPFSPPTDYAGHWLDDLGQNAPLRLESVESLIYHVDATVESEVFGTRLDDPCPPGHEVAESKLVLPLDELEQHVRALSR